MEENEQQNLAIMLMVVVSVFVICNILAMVCNLLDVFDIQAGILVVVITGLYYYFHIFKGNVVSPKIPKKKTFSYLL